MNEQKFISGTRQTMAKFCYCDVVESQFFVYLVLNIKIRYLVA